MVILIFHEHCVLVFECEGHAPIAVNFDRPVIRERALELMEIPTGNVHAPFILGRVQKRKLPTQLDRMGGMNPRLASRQIKPLQTRMTERSNHGLNVARSAPLR